MEEPVCTRPIGMNSSARSEEGQAQLHKDRGIGTVARNEVHDAGRGQTVPSLGSFTEKTRLYLIRNRKHMKDFK